MPYNPAALRELQRHLGVTGRGSTKILNEFSENTQQMLEFKDFFVVKS